MNKLMRLARLRALVSQTGGRIDGRKKLHKLVYLCQHAGTDLGQSFVFHMYGVYSPSLAQDLASAVEWGVLSERPVNDAYEIALGEAELPVHLEALKSHDRGLSIVEQLGKEPAGLLEVLSTIAYLATAGYGGDQLEGKLRELKGHLGSYFPRAFALAREHFGISVAVTP